MCLCTTLCKAISPSSACLHPWYLVIKVCSKQSPLYPHVFKVTPTCCIFWVFFSCSVKSRLAETLNIQPKSMVSFGNKLMCSSFSSFQLNKNFPCANSQRTTIWHFPDDAGIKTGDLVLLFESKNSSKASWKFCQQELDSHRFVWVKWAVGGGTEPCSQRGTWRGKFERGACSSSQNSEVVSVVSQSLHAAEHLKGLLRYLAELVPTLMSWKEELMITKILWCWNMILPVNLPASTCPYGSVHKAHGW